MSRFISIEEALATMKAGKMVILLDDEQRENEGDLIIAAEFADHEAVNFMSRFGRGLICLAMSGDLTEKLQLPMMTPLNRSPFGTAFTVSIEAATGVTTGISAKDRARTIAVAVDPASGPADLISPGHVFPLKANPHGVLQRQGQTEGSVDLARLAGLTPAAVICEIINEDGTMSRRDQLETFSIEHNIPLVTIKDLREWRIQRENLVTLTASSRLPIQDCGDFSLQVYSNFLDNREHFLLTKPPKVKNQVPLVRIHSECITGDVFGSCKCDCGHQLHQSLKLIAEEGGVLIYLRQEGRGIGLSNKVRAYALQEQGYDTIEANEQLGLPADSRDYAIAYQMLKHLGIDALRLITNNPQKIDELEKYGLKIVERVAQPVLANGENRCYLLTKKVKMGHFLAMNEENQREAD
ncbi:MAG: GTP cyclohydrolase II [Legionellaceae bacterium]|nr:GTP cyclohydrolase II [Legionellaceae bacterium]